MIVKYLGMVGRVPNDFTLAAVEIKKYGHQHMPDLRKQITEVLGTYYQSTGLCIVGVIGIGLKAWLCTTRQDEHGRLDITLPADDMPGYLLSDTNPRSLEPIWEAVRAVYKP